METSPLAVETLDKETRSKRVSFMWPKAERHNVKLHGTDCTIGSDGSTNTNACNHC